MCLTPPARSLEFPWPPAGVSSSARAQVQSQMEPLGWAREPRGSVCAIGAAVEGSRCSWDGGERRVELRTASSGTDCGPWRLFVSLQGSAARPVLPPPLCTACFHRLAGWGPARAFVALPHASGLCVPRPWA